MSRWRWLGIGLQFWGWYLKNERNWNARKNKIKINWRETLTLRKRKWKHGWKKKNWRNANAIENEGTWTWFCPWKITFVWKVAHI
jgi:hypothetical protein